MALFGNTPWCNVGSCHGVTWGHATGSRGVMPWGHVGSCHGVTWGHAMGHAYSTVVVLHSCDLRDILLHAMAMASYSILLELVRFLSTRSPT